MKTFLKVLIIFLLCSLILIPFSFYFIKFHGPLSINQSYWSNFGEYIGGISAFFNLIAFIWISYYLYQIDQRNSKNKILVNQLESCLELAEILRIRSIQFIEIENPRTEELIPLIQELLPEHQILILKFEIHKPRLLKEANITSVKDTIVNVLAELDEKILDNIIEECKEIRDSYRAFYKATSKNI